MFPLFTGYGQCCIQILLLTTNCLRPTAANCCQLLPTPSLQDRRAGECIVTDNPPVEDGVIVIRGGALTGTHSYLLTYRQVSCSASLPTPGAVRPVAGRLGARGTWVRRVTYLFPGEPSSLCAEDSSPPV